MTNLTALRQAKDMLGGAPTQMTQAEADASTDELVKDMEQHMDAMVKAAASSNPSALAAIQLIGTYINSKDNLHLRAALLAYINWREEG
jgi:hypothetical protein